MKFQIKFEVLFTKNVKNIIKKSLNRFNGIRHFLALGSL